MQLKVKRLVPQAQMPEYKTPGAAAFDLGTIETKTLEPGEIHRFRTGLVFVIPEGYYMLIANRSSSAPKRGLGAPNGVGIIDSDHRGETDEVSLVVQNVGRKPVTVTEGERIAQAMILPVPRVEFVEVTSTGAADRGNFGSTGQ